MLGTQPQEPSHCRLALQVRISRQDSNPGRVTPKSVPQAPSAAAPISSLPAPSPQALEASDPFHLPHLPRACLPPHCVAKPVQAGSPGVGVRGGGDAWNIDLGILAFVLAPAPHCGACAAPLVGFHGWFLAVALSWVKKLGSACAGRRCVCALCPGSPEAGIFWSSQDRHGCLGWSPCAGVGVVVVNGQGDRGPSVKSGPVSSQTRKLLVRMGTWRQTFAAVVAKILRFHRLNDCFLLSSSSCV